MDYSQFLHMREELSLVVVLLLLFLADLFMSPDAHKNDGKARLNTMLPVILMRSHTQSRYTGDEADNGYTLVPRRISQCEVMFIGTGTV